MLIELWEKLRGYDKWVEATASVTSAKVEQGNIVSNGVIRVEWRGQDGKLYSEQFLAAEESPLYQLLGGDMLTVRMNPRRPDQVYIPRLIESDLMVARRYILVSVSLVLVVIAYFLPEILRLLGIFAK